MEQLYSRINDYGAVKIRLASPADIRAKQTRILQAQKASRGLQSARRNGRLRIRSHRSIP